MGRGKWKKKGKFKKGGGWANQKRHKPYEETVKENANFEKFYRDQKIIPEGQWDAFMACMRTTLGVTFRVNLLCPYRERIKDTLRNELQFEGQVIKVETKTIPPPFPVPWYPDEAVWQISTSKRNIRKSPLLNLLHKWLVREQAVGNISRQELVSMVPPLLLDPKPDHTVLDMCASPGSKTVQILEMMHSQEVHSKDKVSGTGMVVANDVDSKRAYMLVHQCKRIGSPSLVVTCHAAQFFPRLKRGTARTNTKVADDGNSDLPPSKKTKCEKSVHASNKTAKTVKSKKNSKNSKKRGRDESSAPSSPFLVYDRVLADVPCSGDGTMRKQPDIWKHWGVGHGNVLHPLQRQIAMRGASLLAVGGRMVYSTCSLNPIEDEAVVAAILRGCEGSLQLVDCSDMYPTLLRQKGLNTWLVADSKLNYYDSYESVSEEQRVKYKFRRSMWPPTKEECEWMHLDRCMRFLPHSQDTGGFFVTVLEKVAPLKSSRRKRKDGGKSKVVADANDLDDEDTTEKSEKKKDFSYSKKKSEKKLKKNDPHGDLNMYHPCPHKIWEGVRQFFGINQRFPEKQLFIRTSSAKCISYVSGPIAISCLNEEQMQRAARGEKQLKIVHTGLKMFEKQKNCPECDYRLHQEGIHVILPFITKRRIECSASEFLAVLKSRRNMKLGQSPLSALSSDSRTLVEKMCQGPLVFVLDVSSLPAKAKVSANSSLACVAWRGRASYSLMARKDDVSSLIEAVEAMVQPDKPALDQTAKSKAMLEEKRMVAAVAAVEAADPVNKSD